MNTQSYMLKVVDVLKETADAHSIAFEVPQGISRAFAYKPGQFLTIAVPSDLTGVAVRCYSLSSSPLIDGSLAITVKRTPNGYASNWICDNIRNGSSLRVLPPSGIFTPASLDADLLLFAGGSGITPITSIIRTALAQGSGRVVLFYANRDDSTIIFFHELATLTANYPDRLIVKHWLETVHGVPDHDQLTAFATPFRSFDAFVCGPPLFMKAVTTVLKELEFPRANRHQERFVSIRGNPFSDL